MSTVKKLSPFDFLNSINMSKKDLMEDPETENQYVPFVVNRSLSYFPDTVALANEMNKYHHLDNRLQYSFLINTIRKRKRFSKWVKPDMENNIEKVKEYYGYSNEKAHQVLPLLSKSQLVTLKEKVNKGGKRK